MNQALARLSAYLLPNSSVSVKDEIPSHPIANFSPGMAANAYYFGHPKWAKTRIDVVHRYPELAQRWLALAGTWDDKIVVDVGCGPGNLHGSPKVLIGIDVSVGALVLAQRIGYTPLRADAQDIPLASEFPDVVALNATLHHCDNMARVLGEAARLVRPGGVLVADHDPQRSAYEFRGVGRWLWNARLPLYRLPKRGGHSREDDEKTWALATELHHEPGDGLTREMLIDTLRPLSFEGRLYPHNHRVEAEVWAGRTGRAPLRMRVTQRHSGINPNSPEACMSLMCLATRNS
jgi:SAM-dependent methyltransferase